MSIGIPVVFNDAPQDRQFKSLAPISTRRSDPSSFDEDLLQKLVEESPSILPVREFLPSASALFSLGREVPVNIGDSDGFIDNLLITNDGFVVIVETKLYRNPEATRDVVTQTLQYGMAVGQMPILELETRIRRGQNPSLRREESIRDCVFRQASSDQGLSASISDDFEESLERNLRRGEILLLVVSDGIRPGVEQVTNWLNGQGNSTAYKFGLVELKFYTFGDQRLAIPRAVLKTQEVSRHVVVVDIQPKTDLNVAARVTDEFQNTSGGKVQESRQIRAASVPLTKGTLLQIIADQVERDAASRLSEQMEILGFDQRGTSSILNFGFTDENDFFHPLVDLCQWGVWTYLRKRDRDLLGEAGTTEFRKKANQFGRFYREDQLSKLDSAGCQVKYSQLSDSAAEFAAFFDSYRTKIGGLLEPK